MANKQKNDSRKTIKSCKSPVALLHRQNCFRSSRFLFLLSDSREWRIGKEEQKYRFVFFHFHVFAFKWKLYVMVMLCFGVGNSSQTQVRTLFGRESLATLPKPTAAMRHRKERALERCLQNFVGLALVRLGSVHEMRHFCFLSQNRQGHHLRIT